MRHGLDVPHQCIPNNVEYYYWYTINAGHYRCSVFPSWLCGKPNAILKGCNMARAVRIWLNLMDVCILQVLISLLPWTETSHCMRETHNTIWPHRSGSILVKLVVYCLTTPSHYLNHCHYTIANTFCYNLYVVLTTKVHEGESCDQNQRQQPTADGSARVTFD